MNWTEAWESISPVISAIGGSVVVSAFVLKFLADRMLDELKNRDAKDREEIAHERSTLLAERQNAFSMGANSHMAAVVFDKYVEFCEEYVAAVSKALSTLSQEESMGQLLDARDLFTIRQKWALWVSHEIDGNLDEFERRFTQLQFFDSQGAPALTPNENNIKQVIAALRKSISTDDFVTLRKKVLDAALIAPPIPD